MHNALLLLQEYSSDYLYLKTFRLRQLHKSRRWSDLVGWRIRCFRFFICFCIPYCLLETRDTAPCRNIFLLEPNTIKNQRKRRRMYAYAWRCFLLFAVSSQPTSNPNIVYKTKCVVWARFSALSRSSTSRTKPQKSSCFFKNFCMQHFRHPHRLQPGGYLRLIYSSLATTTQPLITHINLKGITPKQSQLLNASTKLLDKKFR